MHTSQYHESECDVSLKEHAPEIVKLLFVIIAVAAIAAVSGSSKFALILLFEATSCILVPSANAGRASMTQSMTMTVTNGITKKVMADSGDWNVDDKTKLGGDYTYRVAVTCAGKGYIKNVIIYDVLENAENTGGHVGESAWHGTFQGVDTSFANRLGYKTVIYYSTTDKEKLNYNTITGTEDKKWLSDTTLH